MGVIKKGKRQFRILLVLMLACALAGGCGEKSDAANKDTASVSADAEKKATKAKIEESQEEEIPDGLLPGQTDSEEKNGEETTAGTAGSVFDASDAGVASGTNPGTMSQGAASSSDGTGNAGSSSTNGGTSEASEISISVSVDSSAVGNPVAASGTVVLKRGSTAYDALTALVGDNLSASGGYVAGIGGLSEKDYGKDSGWLYSVNGVTPGKGSTLYTLKDGDVVRWSYKAE